MRVECLISIGELIDKYSILIIKQKHIDDRDKLKHVKHEAQLLKKIIDDLKLDGISKFLDDLVEINFKLWKIEDEIREKERIKQYDDEFVQLARSVYLTNDIRFQIKNQINETFGSEVKEVKSYKEY